MFDKKIVEIKNYSTSGGMGIVTWDLSNRCNFDCSYCPPTVHDKTSKFHSWETVKLGIERLSKYSLDINKKIKLTLLGGEPLINPWLDQMLAEISRESTRFGTVGIVTNFSLPKKILERIFSSANLDNIRFNISPSFHREFMDPDEYVDKIHWVKENFPKIKLSPTVMLYPDPEGWEISLKIYSQLPESVFADLRPVRKDFGSELMDYSKEQKEFIDDYFNQQKSKRELFCKVVYEDGTEQDVKSPAALFAKKLNNWKGWSCSAGISTLHIKSDLTVCRAICGKTFKPHQLGNLLDFDLGRLQFSTICKKENCRCTADIALDKKRVDSNQQAEVPTF